MKTADINTHYLYPGAKSNEISLTILHQIFKKYSALLIKMTKTIYLVNIINNLIKLARQNAATESPNYGSLSLVQLFRPERTKSSSICILFFSIISFKKLKR